MTDDVPALLRKFLPEQSPEPTPAERFDAWLIENGPEADAERWRVRSRPADRRTWPGIAVPAGIGLAVVAVLAWRVIG